MITRLTAEWQAEYDAWQQRDLAARRCVDVWADGVEVGTTVLVLHNHFSVDHGRLAPAPFAAATPLG